MERSLLTQMEQAASRAARRAYCPYSNFPVGAAVLTEEGRIFSGANVENASYGLTICAERVAIAKAVSAGARRIRAVLVFAPTKELPPPCGACLQVISEFGEDCEVILTNGCRSRRTRLRRLLPFRFRVDR
ncbi:MAG: cytidine deaminase [candidate division WOR-3 bacterium]